MTWRELLTEYFLPGPEDKGVDALRKVLNFQREAGRARRRVPSFDLLCQVLELMLPNVDRSPFTFRAALENAGLLDADIGASLEPFARLRSLGMDLSAWFRQNDVYRRYQTKLRKVKGRELYDYVRTIDLIDRPTPPKVMMADSWYYVTDRSTTLAILEAFPYESLPFYAERRDCDDFARMLKAWLSRQGLGNLAVGEMWATFRDERDGKTVRFAHAVALAVYQEEDDGPFQYFVWEPQREGVLYREDAGASADDRAAYDDIEPYFILF